MKHSKQLDYLATIKKNHKIIVQFDKQKDDKEIDTMWRHYNSLRYMNRLAGFPLLHPYTVAIHCYYTGILFEEIAFHENIAITKRELYFVFRHDLLETITGDVLLPVKIHSKSVKEKWESIEKEMVQSKYTYLRSFNNGDMERIFSPEAWNLFKACDLFELYLFCQEETELGNMTKGIWTVLKNCQNLLPEFNIRFINERIDHVIQL